MNIKNSQVEIKLPLVFSLGLLIKLVNVSFVIVILTISTQSVKL